MSKSNFLLVDLNESKTKKLAETITSDTSRKILNHLAEKENDTETNISKTLNIPISTVHYHLQKLNEAKLVEVKEYHYSEKGREVNHYRLANKYIIIAPKKTTGLKEKLKGILPVAFASVTISAIIKFVQKNQSETFASALKAAPEAAMDSVVEETAAALSQELPQITNSPDIALWFLIGSLTTITLYTIYQLIKERKK